MAKRSKKKKSRAPKKGARPAADAPAIESQEPAGPDEDEAGAPSADEASPALGDEIVVEDAPVAQEPADALQTDEPVDEPTADVVSADPSNRLLEQGELHAALEALLFTSPDPLSVNKLARALGDLPKKDVQDALTQLAAEYEEQGRGFRIIEVAGGFQMATAEGFSEYILRLGTKKKQSALSGAMLETLAIIAYRQPVIRAVVESIRGVESSGVVRNLLDLGLIEVVGRKEVIGRPQMYGTTEKFLRSFGLRDLKDLPSIRGLREKLEAEEAEADRKQREAEATKLAEAEVSDETAEVEDVDDANEGDETGESAEPENADDDWRGDDEDAVEDDVEVAGESESE